MVGRIPQRRMAAAAILVAVALAACDCGPTEPPRAEPDTATVVVRVPLARSLANQVVVQITASDLPDTLFFNLPVVDSVASGAVAVPVGSSRVFTLSAYDANGTETHRGQVTTDVLASGNPPLSVDLAPLYDDITLTATISEITITVEPTSGTVAVGDTLTLTAYVVQSGTDTLTDAPVYWVSSNSSYATVETTDSAGYVIGQGLGDVTIVAVLPFNNGESLTASAEIEVREPLLEASGDSRWLQYLNGEKFYVNGEAAWSIMASLTKAEAKLYLEDRADKGVNLIMLNLIEHRFTPNSPHWENAYGEVPFDSLLPSDTMDFSTPNEAYWEHVDWVIDEAARLGIVVFALPAYVGYNHSNEGWAAEIAANDTANMRIYGEFLGDRYKDRNNIIWVMGGDWGPTSSNYDLTDEINALANGIKSVDSNHLMTAHAQYGHSGRDDYDESWMDFDTAYPSSGISVLHEAVRTAYQSSPTEPVLMIEAYYGNEHNTDNLELRKQAWQSVLGGSFGHIYGNSPTWFFGLGDNSNPAESAFPDDATVDWRDELDSFGADDLPWVAKLQAARDLSAMTPDYSHTYVTAGYGTEDGSYAPVMANTQMLVAYTPDSALTVDKSQFVSATFNVNWYDPDTGQTTSGGTATFGSGSQVFTPPAGDDWVLLLDDQALSLGPP